MADQKQIIIIRRDITTFLISPHETHEDDESNMTEATFYVSVNCDEKTLDSFIRQYRTRMEID